jgi:hypothetical protein
MGDLDRLTAGAAAKAAAAPPKPAHFDATPAKLAGKEWGARVSGSPVVGDRATITTRAGKSWDVEIVAVLSVDGGQALCRTRSLDGGPPTRARRDRGSSVTRFNSGAEVYTNRNGRCEDAPCCGCCS